MLPAIAALHYREDLFPEPEEFRPERFLDGKADNYAWIPFGGGVRRCIGAAFAEYEMRIVLREFVERAELRAADPKPEKVKVRNITLAPAQGTRVVLERPLALRPPARLGCRACGRPPTPRRARRPLRFASSWRLVARSARPGLDQAAGSASSSSTSRSSASAALDPLLQPRRLARRLLRRLGRRCTCRRRRLAGFAAAAAAGLALRRARAGTRPSRSGGCCSSPSSQTRVRLPTASSRARSWETRTHRALELGQRVLERLAALDVEVVGRLVEDQHVGAGGDEDRQREPPLLAAGDVAELLLDVGAGEEEAAEQRRAPSAR